MSMEQREIWRVVNANVKNALGYPVGYELIPEESAMSMLLNFFTHNPVLDFPKTALKRQRRVEIRRGSV